MKLRSVAILAAVVLTAVVHPLVAQPVSEMVRCSDVKWPPLQPSDAAYPDAVVLTRALADNELVVQCIAPSKMTHTFEGQTGAALH